MLKRNQVFQWKCIASFLLIHPYTTINNDKNKMLRGHHVGLEPTWNGLGLRDPEPKKESRGFNYGDNWAEFYPFHKRGNVRVDCYQHTIISKFHADIASGAQVPSMC